MQTTTHRTLFVSVLTIFFGLLTLSASAAGDQIAVVDQEIQNQKDSQNGQDNHQVLILNQDANWGTGDSAVVWKVDRKELNGAGWDHLSDVKLRTDSNGVRVVLVTAGGGNVGSINYNTGRLIWHTTIPTDKGTPNPHSIELLPNGAVAVADTNGYIWYFPYGSHKPEKPYPLHKAHAVLYNDGRLWALGDTQLNQYDIHPTSLKQFGDSIGGFSSGHDLSPIYGDPKHQMWISGDKVYTFNKYSGTHGQLPKPVPVPGAESRSCVKSIGNQPDDGRTIVEAWINHCDNEHFTTDTVYLFDKYGNNPGYRTRPHAGFYKARPVVWGYY